MSDEIKDRNIRDIRELARAVSDELSRENPKYIDSLRDHFAGWRCRPYFPQTTLGAAIPRKVSRVWLTKWQTP